MGDPNSSKPGFRPTADPPVKPAAAGKSGTTGRVVHDERGNAVWDWVKETSRIAIESTSRLLRKLETPELKVEDEKEQELRIESDRDPGGGYDPYNQVTTPRKPGRK
jgi:hypothetical protein